jgi:hypothetical protein
VYLLFLLMLHRVIARSVASNTLPTGYAMGIMHSVLTITTETNANLAECVVYNAHPDALGSTPPHGKRRREAARPSPCARDNNSTV